MENSLSSATEFKVIARTGSHRPKQRQSTSKNRVSVPETAKPPTVLRVDSDQVKLNKMERSDSGTTRRTPLSEVVSDCVKRCFQDTLKEARAGDISMQVLVAQMYYSGYGVPRDSLKGQAWVKRASKGRAHAWDVIFKRPGYGVSDSDSDEGKDDAR